MPIRIIAVAVMALLVGAAFAYYQYPLDMALIGAITLLGHAYWYLVPLFFWLGGAVRACGPDPGCWLIVLTITFIQWPYLLAFAVTYAVNWAMSAREARAHRFSRSGS